VSGRARIAVALVVAASFAAAADDSTSRGFLGELEAAARAQSAPADRGAALAWVAWMLVRAGDTGRARGMSETAEQDARGSKELAHRAHALARVAAVRARLGDAESAEKLFAESLADISAELASKRPGEGKKALVAWLGARADARSGSSAADPLVEKAIELLDGLQPTTKAVLLKDCAPQLVRLGRAESVRERSRSLIARGDLPLLHLEDAVFAVDAIEEKKPLAPAERKAVFDAVEKQVADVDEFAPPMMLVALRGESAPWEKADALATTLASKGHAYAALLARYAGVLALSERDDRAAHADRLERVLDAAFAHAARGSDGEPHLQRMRVIVRATRLVPSMAKGERALAHVRRVESEAVAEQALYVSNELFAASASAAAKLGGDEAKKAVREITSAELQRLETEWKQEGRRDVETASATMLLESLGACVAALADAGDAEGGRELVGKVAEAARRALAAPQGPNETARLFYPRRCLSACGRAYGTFGEASSARTCFDGAIAGLEKQNGMDRIEVLSDALRATKGLARELREERAAALARALAAQPSGIFFDDWCAFFALADEVAGAEKDRAGK
jgi:hypothetical protein